MFPPVYATCAAAPAVRTLLTGSDGRLRLFPFGEAAQHYPNAYAVWSIVYGAPENSLSCIPDVDLYGVQIDVYAATADKAHEVAAALRDAIEGTMQALVVRYNGESREAAAGNQRSYRYSFDVEWRVYRPALTT